MPIQAHHTPRSMQLSDLSPRQLYRVYTHLYASLPGGLSRSWDWPTLRTCYPGKAFLMRSILAEIHRRRAALAAPKPTYAQINRA